MSLLIKALATAEKDKQKAKSTEHPLSLTPDALSLAPFESASPVGMDVAVVQDETLSNDNSKVSFASSPDDGTFNDIGLSLAEEAGLISPDVKVKGDVAVKSGPASVKSEAKQKSKADAFNEAAMASVASLKAQGNAAKDGHQRAAANAFVANQAVKTGSSRSALLLLGFAGALIILLGFQGYQYFQTLMADDVVVVKPAALKPVALMPVVNTEAIEGNVESDVVASNAVGDEVSASEQVTNQAEIDAIQARLTSQMNAELEKRRLEKQRPGAKAESNVFDADTVADESRLPAQKSVSAVAARKQANTGESNPRESYSSELKEPLKLVSKTPIAGVDPTLLAAYEAFSRGDDSSAQQKYRQVLQKDIRNVDALLGMAAIAQRQDRNMDAIGWYRKVTEIEPRNTIAQSAMADLEANADGVGAESKIKSMLARQPDAANLHAALGNLYAAQNQWASAQSAYFNASQYAPISADYAFNLAISLEHLGKPKLALVQYQRALDLLNITGATSPDRAQLEARVRALQ